MANRNGREALRGAGEETFDILAEVLTSEQWGELLRAPLERTAAEGNSDVAQKLVRAGSKVGNALHGAVRAGYEEVVTDLVENGASVAAKDTDGCTPLHVAAREGTTEIVKLLLLKGADKDALDKYQWTPLYQAVSEDKAGAALALLAAGADVSLRCHQKESVLHAAAEHGHIDIMRAAIERGADVNAVTINHSTPLHVAALYFDNIEAIDVLVEAGAKIDARDDDGEQPLHRASSGPAPEAVLALLKHGADVNAQDKYQWTPLHCATVMAGKQGAAEVVDSLLRAGADETMLNVEGNAPAGVVGRDVYELSEEFDRVRQLLANAPADRAWRRRGYLALCRTHPDRAHKTQHISGATVGAARRARSSAKLGRTETSHCTGTAGGGITDGQTSGDWAVVVARVLELKEESIFRTIVGYL